MTHEIPGIEGASIKQLFQSISSIKIYQQGFNDGVDAVSKSLQSQLGQKSIEAAESLGINPAEFMLDPVNAAFLPKEQGQVGPRPAAEPRPSPHELARMENERRAAELRQNQLNKQAAAIEEERRRSQEKLEELNGSIKSFTPPMAQPLASPEIPLASQVARNGTTAAKIDKQVDTQVDAVLKSIRERNK